MRSGLRIDGKTWEEFLRLVGVGVAIGCAAKKCGFSRSAVYYRRDHDEEFASALRDALEDSIDILDTKAFEVAVAGDADMIKFILRNRRRHVYGDKIAINPDNGPRMSDTELACRIASILASGGVSLEALLAQNQRQ